VSVKVTGKEIFNNACINSHSSNKHTIVCTEKENIRAEVQDNCVSCHMPRSGSIDIPHVSVHDHYIRKPLKKVEVEKVKTFIALYAVNEKNPSPAIKAKAYLQQFEKFESMPVYLDSAKAFISDKNATEIQQNIELLIHLCYLKEDFSKIAFYVKQVGEEKLLGSILTKKSVDNAHAWTLYRIGEAFNTLGNTASAVKFYEKANELAPYNPDFMNKLGVALMLQKQTIRAIQVLERAVNEDPKFVQGLNNLGYAYLSTGNLLKAEAIFNNALKLDPDYELLLMNVVGLNLYKKNYKEAEKLILQILEKNPNNQKAWTILSQLKQLH
jgi:tetratricopeptide (TPR) repeat protein